MTMLLSGRLQDHRIINIAMTNYYKIYVAYVRISSENYGNYSKRQPLWNMEINCMNTVIFHEDWNTGSKTRADE